jgi:hypothetical protein
MGQRIDPETPPTWTRLRRLGPCTAPGSWHRHSEQPPGPRATASITCSTAGQRGWSSPGRRPTPNPRAADSVRSGKVDEPTGQNERFRRSGVSTVVGPVRSLSIPACSCGPCMAPDHSRAVAVAGVRRAQRKGRNPRAADLPSTVQRLSSPCRTEDGVLSEHANALLPHHHGRQAQPTAPTRRSATRAGRSRPRPPPPTRLRPHPRPAPRGRPTPPGHRACRSVRP